MLAIGRALLTNPRVLIMDEPSEGLAPTIVEGLVQTIKDLAAEGMGLLVVEQNLGVATALAERQLVMVTGAIATETTADALASDPSPSGATSASSRWPTPRRGYAAATSAWSAGLRPASTPPSTGSVVPVIQPAPARGEEQHRLDDVRRLPAAAERVEPVDGLEHLLRLLRRHEALVGRRLDERERDRVDADAVRGQLEREVLGQHVPARLGGGVGARRRRRDRVERPHRADVDDRAAAALAHRRHDGLGDPVCGAQDRAERLLEMLLGLLLERHRPEDAGAVDEHVDRAEALERVGRRAPGRRRAR